jgi:flagellar basal-body rod modification protein FlgD
MSISPIEATPTGMFGTPATSSTTDGSSTSSTSSTQGGDKNMFLQLLVAQMRYQDPSNPTDSTQFLSQTAQFTALEKMTDVADKTTQLLSAQMAFGASGLVGRHVTYADSTGATGQGTVDGVTFGTDGPMLTVGSASIPLAQVQSVTAATA